MIFMIFFIYIYLHVKKIKIYKKFKNGVKCHEPLQDLGKKLDFIGTLGLFGYHASQKRGVENAICVKILKHGKPMA